MKNNSTIFVVLVIIILVVFSVECTSLPSQNSSNSTDKGFQTFSDGNISFNYPIGFDISSRGDNLTTERSSWNDLTYLLNGEDIAIVAAYDSSKNSALEARNEIEGDVLSAKGTIISKTTKNNPNGIVVEEITSRQTDIYSYNTVLIFMDMFFKVKGVVYGITVSGDISKSEEVNNTANIILNSLKSY